MSGRTFLLEIGVEELPARFCGPALEQLRSRGEALLGELRLPFTASRTVGTPRRLGWVVEGLGDQQDAETVVRGPSRAAAYDADGRPTRAALGFAQGQGVEPDALFVGEERGKEYVFARRVRQGQSLPEALGPALPGLVGSLEFPRTMRWGDQDFRFPRPIRWLVALWGGDVVACAVAGVRSGRQTFGHRTLHPGPVALGSAEAYEPALEAAGVLVDPEARRGVIAEQLHRAAAGAGGRLRDNPELLDEVTFIVEWPTAFVGRFDPAALEVPEPVLTTVMRVHQRYFPIEASDGRLLPAFAAVRNGASEHLDTVIAGNERVLAARFADARFFYTEDRRQPLAERAGRLAMVAFAEGLGTMAGKTERIAALALELGRSVVGVDAGVLIRAAHLCKADRLTQLVYEFPELEGTMGGHYAAADGEPADVAQAIAEHVLPRGAGDDLPRSPAGRLLALADRLDTLAGQFLLGRAPTGSADPYGLRRAALAVIRILEDSAWDISLSGAVAFAIAGYSDVGTNRGGAESDLRDFMVTRLRGRLEEAGFRYDVVDAVLAAGVDGVTDAFARCRALTAAAAAPGWEDTLTAFKRAGNLARQGEATDVAGPFGHPAEERLDRALQAARQAATAALAARDYGAVFGAVADLRRPVDDFLTELLVMDPDPTVRARRLSLLRAVAQLAATVADLSRLQG